MLPAAILLLVPLVLGATVKVEIERVSGDELEASLQTEEAVGVVWDTKNCKTCDKVIGLLERVGEEVANNGVLLVRVNDKRAAKKYGIRNFPALTLFKGGDPVPYEGDLADEDQVIDFLQGEEEARVQGKIPDVTTSQLEAMVEDESYVAVFFYTGNFDSSAQLKGLSKLSEFADKLNIKRVKINDLELVTEYSLGELPALVYYRHTLPILFEGDLESEEDILEWLVQNRNSGEEKDTIEEVDTETLEAMVSAVENIVVLFYNAKSTKSDQILEVMEEVDNDCETRGAHFVKIGDPAAAYHYGVSTLPSLVFFKNTAPDIYDGSLLDGEALLPWLLAHLESSEIEEASPSMLGKLLREARSIVVVFCKYTAYAIIALTHTCYLIKNYAPDDLKKFLPPQNVRGMASET